MVSSGGETSNYKSINEERINKLLAKPTESIITRVSGSQSGAINTEGGVNRILSIPLSFPRAGVFGDGGLSSRSSSGSGGVYWSSRSSGGTGSYLLNFDSTANIYRYNVARRVGGSVRCVVSFNFLLGGVDGRA